MLAHGRGAAPRFDISAAVTLVILGGLAWRVVTTDTVAAMNALVVAEDNASHLSIMAGIRDQQAYLYGDWGAVTDQVVSGLQDYPQGVHTVAAVVSHLTSPAALSPSQAVDHYWAALAICWAVLVLALSEVGMALARHLGARGRPLVLAAVLPVLVALLSPFSTLLTLGFFTQIAAYAALVVLVLLAVLEDAEAVSTWSVGLAVAGLVLIAGSWYIVLPIAALPAACVFRRAGWSWDGRGFVLAAGCVLLSGAPHVWSSLGTGGAAAAVNAAGGVVPLGVVVGSLTVIVPLLLHRVLSVDRRLSAAWWLPWAASMGFSLALMAYQLASAGAVSYYFEKSLYTVLGLSTIGIAALVALSLTAGASSSTSEAVRRTTSVLLVVLLLLPLVLHPGTFFGRALREGRPDVPWGQVLALKARRGGAPILFWHFGTPLYDYQANRLLGAVYGQDDPRRWQAVAVGLPGQAESQLQPLLRDGGRLTLLTATAGASRLLARARTEQRHQVEVVVLPDPRRIVAP